jgi:anti-anti-sigma factor
VKELASLFVWHREAVVVAAIAGELDIANAGELEGEIAQAVGNDADGLVLDLAGLTFMDSSGVHVLFHLAERLRTSGRRMAVIAPPGSAPRRLLELSGPEPQSWIQDSEDAAIAAVRDLPRHN